MTIDAFPPLKQLPGIIAKRSALWWDLDLGYLAQSGHTAELHMPRRVRGTIALLSGSLLAFILWSAIAQVNEIAKTEGEVVPSGHVQNIQHLEGGIVREILVQEGERVEEGQILLKLDGAGSEQDLSEIRAKELSLSLQAERLRAYVQGKVPNFDKYNAPQTMVDEQKAIFAGMMRARAGEEDVLRQQIAQRRDALAALQSDRASQGRSLGYAKEARDIQRGLLAKGLASKMNVLKREDDVSTAQGRISTLTQQIAQAEKEISEFEQRLTASGAQKHDDRYQELDKTEGELAQVREGVKKGEGRVGRLEVKAPVSGYVKGLKINTLGGVVGSGESLMEIVPVAPQLVVEVKLSPKDVGHVRLGQNVVVKVDSFDYARYGVIEGRLEYVSATTFVDESRQSFYRARIRLDHDYVGKQAGAYRVLPGMTVDADIVTGKKSVLSYLLKPVQIALNTAFTER